MNGHLRERVWSWRAFLLDWSLCVGCLLVAGCGLAGVLAVRGVTFWVAAPPAWMLQTGLAWLWHTRIAPVDMWGWRSVREDVDA